MFRETRLPIIVLNRTKRSKIAIAKSENHHKIEFLQTFLKGNILRPFLLLTTEPVVFFFTLLSSLSYGLLFIATQSVPQVYSALYNFTEPNTGLIQASIVIGELLGFLACAFIGDRYFARASDGQARIVGGVDQLPEVRLYLAIPASYVGLAGGLFIYGWTSYADVSYWRLPWVFFSLDSEVW